MNADSLSKIGIMWPSTAPQHLESRTKRNRVKGANVADPGMIGDSPTLVASISTVLGGAMFWAATQVTKRLGLLQPTAGEANSQAQKDMLDWQKQQLKDEVQRREVAEQKAQELLDKMNDLAQDMAEATITNKQLQQQVDNLSQTVLLLTATVDQLKAQLAGVQGHA